MLFVLSKDYNLMDPTMPWLILCSGIALGSLFYGWLADRHGRKFSLVYATTLSFYFTILICFTENSMENRTVLFFIGTGMCSLNITSNYSSESFPEKYRPLLQIFLGICSCIGAASASYLASTQYLSWRYFILIVAAFFTIFLLISVWLPESIPYLQMSGCLDELLIIFKRLSESHHKNIDKGVQMVVYTETSRGHLLKLFSKPYLGRTLTMVLLWSTSKMALALSIVLHYSISTLTDENKESKICPENNLSILKRFSYHDLLNCNKESAVFFAVFRSSLAQITGLLLTCTLIKFFRRKTLIVLSLLMTSCCFVISNVCMPKTWHLVFALLSMGFSASFNQILTIFTNEIFDVSIRCTATGFCNFFGLFILIAFPMFIHMVAVLTPLVMTIIYLALAVECFAILNFIQFL